MSNYFSQVPDFEYTSILPDAKLGDFFAVKNFFKRGKLRDDIIQNVAVFEKYQIKGNDRPDNVAFEKNTATIRLCIVGFIIMNQWKLKMLQVLLFSLKEYM